MTDGQHDDRGNMHEQVPCFQRSQFDWKPEAEPENKRRKNCPEIEEDEIEFEGADETKPPVALAP